jgi:hypothetical protein
MAGGEAERPPAAASTDAGQGLAARRCAIGESHAAAAGCQGLRRDRMGTLDMLRGAPCLADDTLPDEVASPADCAGPG